MAKVGAQRAAVLTGKSKSTVQRAMNSGKLSFELDQNGRRTIDVSELERVFGIKQKEQPAEKIETPPQSAVQAFEKEKMAIEIKMLKQQVDTANEIIDDLKDQRDKWERQASQVLITSQYSQKQAEELRAQIKEREERARQRRLQNARLKQAQGEDKAATSPSKKKLNETVKQLEAQNQNTSDSAASVFSFWKRAKG